MTQASLEAYEAMEARQKGAVVKPSEAQILPSQYEVQHAAKALQAASPVVTWQALYDLWAAECERRDNTKAAYLAAMKLFNSFCPKMPQAVVREDVLAYRDFLLQEEELASGTVANKIGFLAPCSTLVGIAANLLNSCRITPLRTSRSSRQSGARPGPSGCHSAMPNLRSSSVHPFIATDCARAARLQRPKIGLYETAQKTHVCQEVGQCCHWAIGPSRAAMRLLPAAQPLMVLNARKRHTSAK
jgi:hypothetical protein